MVVPSHEFALQDAMIKPVFASEQAEHETLSHATGRFAGAEIVPLHSLLSEKIEKLLSWAQARTRHASHRDHPPNGGRKLDVVKTDDREPTPNP